MKSQFNFENLTIWHKAMNLGEIVHKLCKNFPREERFNLTDQLRRASDSVALNIAEGSIIQSKKEFSRFLSYSIRSLAEVVTCFTKAKNRAYITTETYHALYNECYDLMNMMLAFRKRILQSNSFNRHT